MGRKRKVDTGEEPAEPKNNQAQQRAPNSRFRQDWISTGVDNLAVMAQMAQAVNPVDKGAFQFALPINTGPKTLEERNDDIFGKVDPDVMDLVEHFEIEQRHIRPLDCLLKERKETFEADMLRLWDDLARARNANGLLVAQMNQMRAGTFIGKTKADTELNAIFKKFKLDEEARRKLTDTFSRHPEDKKKEYYAGLEAHFSTTGNPSAVAMSLLRKIGEGEPLGEPKGKPKGEGKSDDAKGSGKGKDSDRDRRDQDRDRRDDRRDHRDERKQRWEDDNDRRDDRRQRYDDHSDRKGDRERDRDDGYRNRGRGDSYGDRKDDREDRDRGSSDGYRRGDRDGDRDDGYRSRPRLDKYGDPIDEGYSERSRGSDSRY